MPDVLAVSISRTRKARVSRGQAIALTLSIKAFLAAWIAYALVRAGLLDWMLH